MRAFHAEELELLQQLAGGRTSFAPESLADEGVMTAFKALVHRAQRLSGEGLIGEVTLRPNTQTRHRGHRKMVIDGITPAGREVLRMHDIGQLDSAVRDVGRRQVRALLATCQAGFAARIQAVRSEYGQQAGPASGRYRMAITDATRAELETRAKTARETWKALLQGQEFVLTSEAVSLVVDELDRALRTDCGDLDEALARVHGQSGNGGPAQSLAELIPPVLEDARTQLDFERVAPGASMHQVSAASAGGGPSLVVHGDFMGAFQTGAHSTANVTQHNDSGQMLEVRTELERVRALLEASAAAPADQAAILQTVDVAIAETRKPAPNPVTLRGLILGAMAAVQAIESAPGAYQVLRGALELIGVRTGS